MKLPPIVRVCSGTKIARMRVADDVARYQRVGGVLEDALERSLGGGLDRPVDLVAWSRWSSERGQVDHRAVGHGHAERIAGQLTLQFGDHLADGLGRAGLGRE